MSVSTFDARVRSQDGIVTIDLEGEINAFAEEALHHAYGHAEQMGSARILLNFSKVRYINSTGIALVVALLARARKANRSLVVYGLSDHYQEIFEITRLADYMTVYPDEASAVQAAQ